eukprot:5893473-Pleurochrysis_carterae.AAC.1
MGLASYKIALLLQRSKDRSRCWLMSLEASLFLSPTQTRRLACFSTSAYGRRFGYGTSTTSSRCTLDTPHPRLPIS